MTARVAMETLLAEWLLGQADDQMILAHRNSEWTGHAPILEEDIAFANIALDEMGHAQLLYQLHSELMGEEPASYPDELVFHRQAPAFRNAQIVELPKGDWAQTITRQYLFDCWESILLEALKDSGHRPLAQAAAVMGNEEKYHLEHTRTWVVRLGRGTEESNQRMQRALEALWRPCQQLLLLPPNQRPLVEDGWLPDFNELKGYWLEQTGLTLGQSGLTIPEVQPELPIPPRSQHSEHLMDLLGEMQMVARIFPGEEW